MESLKTGIRWIDDIIPEELPLKSTTVITGPGGSGKPLIGETFVTAWLKKGGSVIFMSLQYPGSEFVAESIKNVTGLDIMDKAFSLAGLQLGYLLAGDCFKDQFFRFPGIFIQANPVCGN